MSEQAPAGWYPDGTGNERFWDGAAWTDLLRAPAPLAPTVPARAATEEHTASGMLSRLGSAVRQASADRKAAKDEALRDHERRTRVAGSLVTSGVFGVSTVEIYQGGYVRIAGGSENREQAAGITKSTPFEKLRSISFVASESAADRGGTQPPSSAVEGAMMQAISGLVKGGKLLSKGTVIGVAATGISQFAANSARKSHLVITTDRAIHTLTNQRSNGVLNVSRKEDDAVARELVEVGDAVLGASIEPALSSPSAIDSVVVAAVPTAPSLAERVRELSVLHREGILSDDEFAAAKAKLISGM